MPERGAPASGVRRLALGIAYRGQAYHGWQSQPGGHTVQDAVEGALSMFTSGTAAPGQPLRTVCAGRTDTGVHALMQVVHLDTPLDRDPFSWVRGTNRYLPSDIAIQWCRPVDAGFHARFSARGRRYRFLVLESPVRPSLESGLVGWVFRPLDGEAMREALQCLLGEHDFTSFRAADCQSDTPVKTLRHASVARRGAYWSFEFDANAFLYHMVRNIVGCLVAIGCGRQPPGWMAQVLAARSRAVAAPTFPPQGLYFVGPYYDESLNLPTSTAAMDGLG